MHAIMRRLESGERWWTAEIVLRLLGLASFGLCVAASRWLYQSVNRPPLHDPSALEWADAAATFLCWSAGGALLTFGPCLFQLIGLPARHARFPHSKGRDR